MPSIAAHMIIADLISHKLGINDELFYKGNLLPDIINIENSHFKIQKEHFLVPDIEFIQSYYSPVDYLSLGYYVHLLLDKYFLEQYIPTYINKYDIFSTKEIYKDYSSINYTLLTMFDIDGETLKEILVDYPCDIKQDKLKANLEYLCNKQIREGVYLKENTFAEFLIDISNQIYKDVEIYNEQIHKIYVKNI